MWVVCEAHDSNPAAAPKVDHQLANADDALVDNEKADGLDEELLLSAQQEHESDVAQNFEGHGKELQVAPNCEGHGAELAVAPNC